MKILCKLVIVCCLLINSDVFSVAKENTFQKYPNKYFVETGSYMGNGIRQALRAGFQYIYSIELSPKFFQICNQYFANLKNVNIFLGDSGKILYSVIKNLDAPITFWLDGHYSGGPTAKGDENSPIINELDQIKMHHIKNHTILIDDVRQFGTPNFDNVTVEQIISKILEINQNYKISYEDGFIKNDILVARVY